MKKLIATLLLSTAVLSCSAQAGEKEILKNLKSRLPDAGTIDRVKKTPYAGLYEVVIDDNLMYTDEKGDYLLNGSVLDTKTMRNLSEERRRVLFAIDFDKLPLDIAVKRVKGDGSRRMAYFTDPQCGYCKKLEQELSKVTNVTLYIFMVPFFQGSDDIVRNVRCAKDPIKAWDDQMLNHTKPADANCATPTDKVLKLAHKMKVNGTPNLVFGNGVQVPGYMPAADLEKALDDTKK